MEDTTTPDAGEPKEEVTSQSAESVSEHGLETIDNSKDIASLEKKLNEVLNDNKKYRDKFKEIEETKKKLALEQAEKNGEYQKIADDYKSQLESATPKLERYEKTIQSTLDTELKKLTKENKDSFNSLFGDIEDPLLKWDKLQKWLNTVPASPNQPVESPAKKQEQNLSKDIQAILKQAKVDGDYSKVRQLNYNINDISKELLGQK